MSQRRILYRARLAKYGKRLFWGGTVLTALLSFGLILIFWYGSIGDGVVFTIFLVILIASFFGKMVRAARWQNNAGMYQISIDEEGLYIHSDDPTSPMSFDVKASEICRLIKKTFRNYDGADRCEYYIETKSGERHQIEQLFVDWDLNAKKLFVKITDSFPWVRIVEEIKD
jgi:hypothetical protein